MIGVEGADDGTAVAGGDAAASSTSERMRFAFLAEVARCLADSLDVTTTLQTVTGLALPYFGGWCVVDVVEPDDTIRRIAVVHPDPAAQRRVRAFYEEHPPQADDPIGAAQVIRTRHSEFLTMDGAEVLAEVRDEAHRQMLLELGARAFLVVPMRARGRTLGAITFVSETRRTYADADLLLAEDLGRRCAMAIDNARLFGKAEEARRQAELAREEANRAAQRANTLRELAETARLEAEAATRAKESMLATLSHEFRTPLGAVLGFVGLLNDGLAGPLTVLQRDYLRRIGNASGSLLRLIEEVLTLSSVGAGGGSPLVADVDVAAIVQEVADLFFPVVAAKRLELVVDLPPSLRSRTDGGKVRQIVINLVGNAIKFTAEGQVRIALATDDGDVVVRVIDSGEGISAEDVERLFTAYRQVGPSRGPARGTGLGLSISRELARLLGGDVMVTSEPGRGSTFTLRIPLELETKPDALAREAEIAERRATGREIARSTDAAAR